ncbi:MAG: hypothetical protein ACOC1I_09005 [Spirochaetota bacterium]
MAAVRATEARHIVTDAAASGPGIMLYAGAEAITPELLSIVIPRPTDGWDISLELGRADLAVLTAVKISANTDAGIRLVAIEPDGDQREKAQAFLRGVQETARLRDAAFEVVGELESARGEGGRSLHIYPVGPDTPFERLHESSSQLGGTCLFTVDSGSESALA